MLPSCFTEFSIGRVLTDTCSLHLKRKKKRYLGAFFFCFFVFFPALFHSVSSFRAGMRAGWKWNRWGWFCVFFLLFTFFFLLSNLFFFCFSFSFSPPSFWRCRGLGLEGKWGKIKKEEGGGGGGKRSGRASGFSFSFFLVHFFSKKKSGFSRTRRQPPPGKARGSPPGNGPAPCAPAALSASARTSPRKKNEEEPNPKTQ